MGAAVAGVGFVGGGVGGVREREEEKEKEKEKGRETLSES